MRRMLIVVAVLGAMLWAANPAVSAPGKNPAASIGFNSDATDAIAIPRLLSYQGKLLDNVGNPVLDTTYSVLFILYTVPSGGSAFWSETQAVRTRAGLFSALLGSVTPIGTLPDAGALYLGMRVGADPEMTPRLRIVSSAYAYLSERAATADLLQGKDTVALDWRFVNQGQPDAISSAMIANGAIIAEDLHYMNALPGQVLKWSGSTWGPADDITGGEVDWVRGSPDSVLFTVRELGIARGGSFNMLHGGFRSSHTNLGIACTTGTVGQFARSCVISGGAGNIASQGYATVGGGYANRNTGAYATIAGGELNQTDALLGTVGGGHGNVARETASCVAGGFGNRADWPYGFVGGGRDNRAEHRYSVLGGGQDNGTSGNHSTLGGGLSNSSVGDYSAVLGGHGNGTNGTGAGAICGRGNLAGGNGGDAVVAGGYYNLAWGSSAAVGGGTNNSAYANDACVPGGRADTAGADYSFAANYHSVVGGPFTNSACFNSEYVTSPNQLRCANLSVSGAKSFTIDHPTDPTGSILNHYCVESPEMLVEYRGKATIGSDGRITVELPAYYRALAREPMIQLTGIGTFEVFVTEKVTGNQFAIGGKPGTEVYWVVTGERNDQSARIARILMPVEQPKTGVLAGRMLDDDYLVGAKARLDELGVGAEFQFRTDAARQLSEDMKRPGTKPESPSKR